MANEEIILKPSTIETIDLAFFECVSKDFNLHTNTNSGFKKVPVLWMSPERSFHVKNKEIRDKVGKLKLPLITIERSSFSKDMTFKGAFQADLKPNLKGEQGYRKHPFPAHSVISKVSTRKFAENKSFDDNNQHHYPGVNKKVVYEEIYTPIPIYVTVMYSVTIRTEYQQQMNDLMTPFVTRAGQLNSIIIKTGEIHSCEAFIQQDFAQSNNMSNLGEEERAFETKFEVKVLGYLLGDGVNEEVPKIIKKETIVEIKLIRERSIVGDEKPWENDDKKYRDV